jgi:hypothetical protein
MEGQFTMGLENVGISYALEFYAFGSINNWHRRA